MKKEIIIKALGKKIIMSLIYDPDKSFHENVNKINSLQLDIKSRIIPENCFWYKLFDYEVISPITLSACPLSATAHSVSLAAQLGFDVITWKTIRSSVHEPHPHPNVTFVINVDDKIIGTTQSTLSLANSIGNASYDLETTLQEMYTAKQALSPGQLLISSIYGCGETQQKIIDDFVYLAQRVASIGVHGIELNCSCPNVSGIYYKDVVLMDRLVRAVAKAVDIPVTIKVGLHDSKEQLKKLMTIIAKAGARGITGINSVSRKVYDKNGVSYFGSNRLHAGVSGGAIRRHALNWVNNVVSINEHEKLGLTILAGGGITNAAQFQEYLDLGADAVCTATGALIDPYIAMHYHEGCYDKKNSNHIVTGSEHHVI